MLFFSLKEGKEADTMTAPFLLDSKFCKQAAQVNPQGGSGDGSKTPYVDFFAVRPSES